MSSDQAQAQHVADSSLSGLKARPASGCLGSLSPAMPSRSYRRSSLDLDRESILPLKWG